MGKKTLKHLDLFSGYGGFTIPASKYGIETINFSEIDKYATAVLKYRFPSITNLGDITKIKPEDLPDVDIITGGSPCQDLSVAGKGAGLDGGRSGLFFCFINLIKEKQPMYFVWENVKGALSSSKGWDFARVQIEMEQAGYDVWWQVINAKDFGVPQNRERIFAIGIRKGSGREILFEQISSGQNTKTNRKVKSARKFGSSGSFHNPDEIVSTLTQSMGTGGNNVPMTIGAKTGLYCVGIIPESIKEKGNYLPRERIFDARGNARAVSTVGSQHPMYAVTARKHRTKFDTSNTVSTLTSHYRGAPDGDGRSAVVVHNLQPRSPNRPSLLKNKNAGGSGHLQREDGVTYTVDTGCTQGVEIRHIDGIMGYGTEDKTKHREQGVSLLQKTLSEKEIQSEVRGLQGLSKEEVLQQRMQQQSDGRNMENGQSKVDGKSLQGETDIREVGNMRDMFNGKEDGNTPQGQKSTEQQVAEPTRGLQELPQQDSSSFRIRRLTPIETERLMGLEDGWTSKGIIDGKEVDISDTQRYKMCGNGVVVNCVDYIYNLISKTL